MPGAPSGPRADHAEELLLASRLVDGGLRQNELSVPSIHCGACVARIERVLGLLPGVERARVNLSTRRVAVSWRGEAPPLVETLNEAGFEAHLGAHLHAADATGKDPAMGELVRALAVAGFASGNIMMLSVGVWSGADAEARDIFHWLSAAIALPSLAYCGRIFFRSAWQAVRRGRTNMDVPISVGVLLAFGMSLYETIHHGPHAYFDAAISLLFFLLIGRTLDHVMRERARTAITGLARLASRGAWVIEPDGSRHYLAIDAIKPGMTLLLAAGDRVPVDARIVEGRSDLDVSLVSGESLPQPVAPGALLQAGTLNLTGPLRIEALAIVGQSFLAEMTRMMEMAEAGRAGYRRLADRAAQLYAPVIHLTALTTFIGWMMATGDMHRAVTIAIAVLIITCPCALGLAVPMVQVVAARRLFERGVMVKGSGALERLTEADHVVFDKTGTLTKGVPDLVDRGAIDPELLAIAAEMAAQSRHPYAQAIAAEGRARNVAAVGLTDLKEQAGQGLEGHWGDVIYRLGRSDWAHAGDARPGVALSADGRLLCSFRFRDELRPGAREAVAALLAKGLSVEILSGDHEEPVRHLAESLNVPWHAAVSPAGKVAHIAALAARGAKVLMVGDGLNDAPSLAAAHVSMATASAADIGRNAADIVFLHDDLSAVPGAIATAREADDLVRQNFVLAVVYNALAVPVAVLGHVTPLIAAIAMSASSIIVIGNALRLGRSCQDRRHISRLAAAPPAPALETGR
jgi:Cu2+-exporting ATPase